MGGKFASETTVSPEKTLTEIRNTLKRYEATGFIIGENEHAVTIAFEMKSRRVKFTLPLPDKKDKVYRYARSGKTYRIGDFNPNTYEQAIRQKWRALHLTIKAKLESVESRIETFEEAFMAQLVLPDGQTVGQWATPQIAQAYLTGNMPPLLGSGS